MPEIAWTIHYELEIEADFLRFYQIYDYLNMGSRKFFRVARRLWFYEDSAVVAKARKLQKDSESKAPHKTVGNPMFKPKVQAKEFGETVEIEAQQESYLIEKIKKGTGD